MRGRQNSWIGFEVTRGEIEARKRRKLARKFKKGAAYEYCDGILRGPQAGAAAAKLVTVARWVGGWRPRQQI